MEVELNEITTSNQMSLLYEAAYSGDVSMLNSLLRQRTHILHKTSQTAFAETPLHISSLLGHLEFTEKLVTLKPDLALEVDSSRMTALHLASAEGHIHIVKKLLMVNREPCLFPDEEGRIPLHYAAMRGRTKVVQELIKAKPESLSFREKGKSVFHLCVTYNHLQTLRALVESESAIHNGALLNFTSSDDAGNTVLHLAIMLKRVEVVSYLLSIPEIKEIANLRNKIGFTTHDILVQSPKNFKICEIQHMLTNIGKEGFGVDHPHSSPPTSTDVVPPQNYGPACTKIFKLIGHYFMKILKWIGGLLRHDDKWIKEMRGNLSLVSTVIATISFQALINPPGGFIQQGLSSRENEGPNDTSSDHDPLSCTTLLRDNKTHTYCPGEALFSSSYRNYESDFQSYLSYISLSFFSSLCVTLLLVSGIFPMKNKLVIWVSSIGMCIALSSLASAYLEAKAIMIPSDILPERSTMDKVSSGVWSFLVGLIVVIITLRFDIWAVRKCAKLFKMSRSWWRENGFPKCLLALIWIIFILVMLVIISVLSFVVAIFIFTIVQRLTYSNCYIFVC